MKDQAVSSSWQPVAYRAGLWALAMGWLVATTLASSQEYTFITLAGPPEPGPGSRDGPGNTARFNSPVSVTVDRAGNVYVADMGNAIIRKIARNGEVTTLAGLAGQTGSQDGIGSRARFQSPSGVAADNAGNVYVADSGNHTIRKITPSGVVTTIAGMPGQAGTNDGSGSAARFCSPSGVATDSATNLYVADSGNYTVRKITPDGTVTTLAGAAGQPGSDDGPGSIARFNYPAAVTADSTANVYVADSDGNTIRKVTPSGVVTTLAGLAGQAGTNDGPGDGARFNSPAGVTADNAGNVYLADTFNHTIRKIDATGAVSTLAGAAGNSGSADGSSNVARFNYPAAVALGITGQVFVVDWGNHTIRLLAVGGTVTTLAGLAGSQGSADGAGSTARFYNPCSVAAANAGTLYVADSWNHTLRRITPDGEVTILAGLAGSPGSADGTGSAARFRYPSGVAVNGAGIVYVADTANHTIRKIAPDGTVTTLAGLAGNFGTNDGAGSTAEFNLPAGIATDSSGNVYVADTANHTLRKITPTGIVTTLTGLAQRSGTNDGSAGTAQFCFPQGVAVDGAGNLYVADQWNQTIRKVIPQGAVSTLAGLARESGCTNGTASAARFNYPRGVAVDRETNIYVADWGNHTLRRISPAGVVTTLAGSAGSSGGADGTGESARFASPSAVAVDGAGNVYVADLGNNSIRKGAPAAPDRAIIDRIDAPVGEARQFGISNLTTTGWSWTFFRRPASSSAEFSSATSWNSTFTPDVPDLYAFRLFATNAAGQVVTIDTVELLACVQLEVNRVPQDRSVALTLHSAAGQPCALLYSTNLTQWTILTNLINVSGADLLLDSARSFPCLFYRLRQD